MNDVSLVRLGNFLEKRIQQFENRRSRARRKWSAATLSQKLRHFEKFETEMERSTATTIAGLFVKARLIEWLADESVTSATIDSRLAASIVRDILQIARNSQNACKQSLTRRKALGCLGDFRNRL